MKIKFLDHIFENLSKKKVVILTAISPELIYVSTIETNERPLVFEILSFSSLPDMESQFFELHKTTEELLDDMGWFARVYMCNPLLSLANYYELLDEIDEALKKENYTTLKMVRDKSERPVPFIDDRLARRNMFFSKDPVYVSSFVSFFEEYKLKHGYEKQYMPLDALPEPLSTVLERIYLEEMNND